MRKYIRILEIQPGGWLLLSVLYFMLDWNLFLIVIFCTLLHEAGHLIMLEWLHVRVRKITLDFSGLTIHYHDLFLGRSGAFLAAAAGPFLGIAAALLFSFVGNLFSYEPFLLLAGGNAVLSVFNLLPAKPLDGWRMLYSLCPVLSRVVSVITSFIILTIGIFLMYAGYGTALAIMGIILMLQSTPRDRKINFRIAY